MIDNEELGIRIYYCLEGMERAINIPEIRRTLENAFEDFGDGEPSDQAVRNMLRSWVKRGWCHEITIVGKQGYYYILSGDGNSYMAGKVLP